MSKSQLGGVAAAAGYRQMLHSLQAPKFSDRVIRQVYCRSVAMDVTNGDFMDGLIGCGSNIGFRVEPAIDIHEYQKNQNLVPQELETNWRWVSIDRAKYFNVKIDRIDKKQICDWDEFASNFCTQASKRMYTELDPEILLKMAQQASKCNKGNNAGMDGDIDLGQYGSPITIDQENIVDALACKKIVIEQSCRWEDGKMFVVMPTIAEKAFYNSSLACYDKTGTQSITLSGRIRDMYMGFKVTFSNHVPRVWDAVKRRWCYYIVFGHEDATGFAQQIDECDVMKIEKSFGDYYRGLWVYGHGTLIPEGVGVCYACFN